MVVVFNVKRLNPTPTSFLKQALPLEPRLLWNSLGSATLPPPFDCWGLPVCGTTPSLTMQILHALVLPVAPKADMPISKEEMLYIESNIQIYLRVMQKHPGGRGENGQTVGESLIDPARPAVLLASHSFWLGPSLLLAGVGVGVWGRHFLLCWAHIC